MQYGRLILVSPDNRRHEFGKGGGLTAELKVHNPDFFKKVLLYGDVGREKPIWKAIGNLIQ
jgi:hypothetical protein